MVILATWAGGYVAYQANKMVIKNRVKPPWTMTLAWTSTRSLWYKKDPHLQIGETRNTPVDISGINPLVSQVLNQISCLGSPSWQPPLGTPWSIYSIGRCGRFGWAAPWKVLRLLRAGGLKRCVGGIPATCNKDATWDLKYIGFGIWSALFKSGFHVVFWFVVQVFGSWGPLPTDMAWIP